MKYAYLSQGKLYVSDDDGKPVEVKSDFANQVVERHRKSRERDDWKSQGGQGGGLGFSPWGDSGRFAGDVVVRIQSVAVSPDEKYLFYVVITDAIGGLFRYDLAEKEERRIFHKENFHADDLCHHPKREQVLCSIGDNQGQSIALVSTERFEVESVTEGDSVDGEPSWVPGSENTIVYQSAGIGRNQHGDYVNLGPFSIERANLETGEHETLLGADKHDYLSPRMDEEGNLYCVRRDYSKSGVRTSHADTLKDVLLIPYRLMKAFFGFLNMMSQMFGKESLFKAGTGQSQEVDRKEFFLKGRLLDLKEDKKAGAEDAVVPTDWELIKVDPSGSVTVLEKGVGDFDLDRSGGVLFTNGKSVITLDGGSKQKIHKGKDIIEAVVRV